MQKISRAGQRELGTKLSIITCMWQRLWFKCRHFLIRKSNGMLRVINGIEFLCIVLWTIYEAVPTKPLFFRHAVQWWSQTFKMKSKLQIQNCCLLSTHGSGTEFYCTILRNFVIPRSIVNLDNYCTFTFLVGLHGKYNTSLPLWKNHVNLLWQRFRSVSTDLHQC